MNDLLTKEESAEAKRQGWCLADVFQAHSNKWNLMILPVAINEVSSVAGVTRQVIAQAHGGHSLSRKALSLITQYNMKDANVPPHPGRRSRRK